MRRRMIVDSFTLRLVPRSIAIMIRLTWPILRIWRRNGKRRDSIVNFA